MIRLLKQVVKLKFGDIIEIKYGDKTVKFEVLQINEIATKAGAEGMIKPL